MGGQDSFAQFESAFDGPSVVFRTRKWYRYVGIFSLAFFLLIGTASAIGMWIDMPPDRRIYAVLFVSLFWSAMAGLSIWSLLACWRESLTIEHDRVIQQGVIRQKVLDLVNIREARWWLAAKGAITLRSLSEKLTIYFGHFERAERLWLMRYFRNALPESIQEGWELFCHKIAMPHREFQPQVENRTPEPDEVRLTRRRWDWYFIPCILVAAVFAIFAWWQLQQPQMLAAPIKLTLFWLLLRFGTPAKGMVTKRTSADPERSRFFVFLFSWLGVAIVGMVLFKIMNPPMPLGMVVGIVALAVWFGVVLWRAHVFDRAKLERDRAASEVSVQRWNEGERGFQR